MCEAVTIATLTAAAIGTALKVRSDSQAASYQTAVARQQEQIQEGAAADALQRGAEEAGRVRMEGSRAVSAARTLAARTGVDGGSTLDVLADSRMFSELDAHTAMNNAAREAWGLRVGAGNARSEQTMIRRRRQSALTGDLFSLGGQAAVGGATIYSNSLKTP